MIEANNAAQKQLRLEQCIWANRRVMTPSELRLWEVLKARKMGVLFRREVPLAGRYVVDFSAPSVRLVVKADGACHRVRPRADARRESRRTAGIQPRKVEQIDRFAQRAWRQMHVPKGHAQSRVACELLNRLRRRAPHSEVRAEGVPLIPSSV